MKIKDYFYSVREEMPGWLKNHKKGDSIDMNEVLKYRTFYYPGCFDDGNPLGLINNARYCHTFIYVDNGVKKNDIIKKLSEYNAFNGYDLVDLVELKETDLIKS